MLLLLKSEIPAGARWITVFPNGRDNKGQPVLIEPQADGSAKVIGGAGGALNHLRLRPVKSEAEHKADAEKAKLAKQQAKKEQAARDKAAGVAKAKKEAKERVQEQQRSHEREFIQTVAKLAGWEDSALAETNTEGLSEGAAKKAAHQRHRELLRRARDEVDLNRRALVADAEMREAAGLGEMPLAVKDPATLSVEDLAPIPTGSGGLGFSPDYGKRAAAAGMTPEDRQREANAAREATMTDAQREAAIKRGEAAKLIHGELQAIREPDRAVPVAKVQEATRAADMLRAAKKLQQVQQQARAARDDIDKSAEPRSAYVLEYATTPEDDRNIAESLQADLRTIRTREFLSEFNRMAGGAPGETLGKHLAAGGFNSINALALAVSGNAMIDRSVVDVLGIAGAAKVLARRIHKDLPADAERISAGMQDFHLHTYVESGEKAMGQARELTEAAKAIEVGEADTAVDLQAGQELNERRRQAVVGAQRILGRVAGEMEANAALVLALQQGPSETEQQFSLGRMNLDQAITQARAIGLRPGDYTVDTAGGTTWLNVKPSGMDRLAQPINRADVEQLRRNLSIAAGDEDEDNWMPAGVARRPDLVTHAAPGAAPRLAQPFEPGPDLHQSLRDYIGGRAADGDTPADIMADIQSADFFQKAGAGYLGALQEVAPLQADGKQLRAEDLAETFDRYADEFVQREYGGERSPLNRQKFELDDTATEALHRALSEHPEGVAAYKPIGDMTAQDQRALREVFYRQVAKDTPEAAAARVELEDHQKAEPPKQIEDLFGETIENPEWADWRERRDELASKISAGKLDWNRYAETMRGHERAYEAIQDLVRSQVSSKFAAAYNTLRPEKPLKVGRAVIRGNLNHLDATDPDAREQRAAREREMIDSLRERSAGRYAAGAVSDKLDAAREERDAFEQAQMGFFSSEEAPAAPEGGQRELAGDERHTIGHEAERQIAALMGRVGANFKPGQPLKVGQATMSGGSAVARQRAIKLVQANKRLGLHLGPGSGKTLVGMGAFTQAHASGQAKRGVFIVPSIVQGQFGGEALKFLEPGKYKWHCEPGANREQRLAAYRDRGNHFCVVTHQAMRDDLLHLGATHAGISEGQMRDRLAGMTRAERKAWASETLAREGIEFDFSAVDEGHNLLDRAGKEDSGLSLAIGGLTDHTPWHMSMTGDPVRNDDPSEVFSALQKIAPDRYTDRAAFMRRYGGNTTASKDALKREMARHFYAHSIEPDVRTDRITSTSKLTDGQHEALKALDRDVAAMRLARMGGKVDVEAAKRVSPGSFAGVPADQHEAVAKSLQDSIGIVRDSATRRVIDGDPNGGKMADLVGKVQARRGKPGIVFSHSIDSVHAIASKLQQAGHTVIMITGKDSADEKDRKRREFDAAPDAVLVCSDAASTGMNGQHGRWVMQYDTPMTAMTHAQREARARRIGQVNDVELIDLVGDHPTERRGRDRLARKYAMREVMTSPMENLDDSGLGMFLTQAMANKGLTGAGSAAQN